MQEVLKALRDKLAERCYCTAAESISSLTVAKDYASGTQIYF